MPNAPTIKLTEAERKSVVELFAFGYTTSAVIDELIKAHADWQTAPRRKLKDAIRTCNPHHSNFAKKYHELYRSTKEQIGAERRKLTASVAGETKELAAAWLHRQLEIIKSVSISPIDITAPRDLVALTKSVSDMVSVAEKIAALPIDDDSETHNSAESEWERFRLGDSDDPWAKADENAREYLADYRTRTGDETDDEGDPESAQIPGAVEDPDTEP